MVPRIAGLAKDEYKMYEVYVLQSLKDKRYYIGCSFDVVRRLESHNNGNVRSTKSRCPFKIIYREKASDLSAARKREIQIKKMKGGIQFKELIMRE